MERVRLLIRIPRWCFVALLVDFVLYTFMVQFGHGICGDSVCYRLGPGTDRMADYFALIIAIMAILIPLAIEIWKLQFTSYNLGPKTPLDGEWSNQNRMRYLHEPIGNMIIFLVGTCLLPLVVRHSALLYADVLYGLYLLAYVFYVSFYEPPINVYDLPALNPGGGSSLPSREVMSELATITTDNAESQRDGKTSDNARPWIEQLKEESTLQQMVAWAILALAEDKKKDVNALTFWVIFYNFLRKCSVSAIWASLSDDGPMQRLFMDKRFYQDGHLMHAAEILKITVQQFTDEDAYNDVVKELLLQLPVSDMRQGYLVDLLMPTLRVLFFKAGDSSYVLSDTLPEDWRVTVDGVDKHPEIVRAIASVFLAWTRDLQAYAAKINEQAVQATTEALFPDVEPTLFAKFVLLWLNGRYLMEPNPNPAMFMEGLGRWHLFGHLGRVSTEWTPVDSEDEVEAQFARTFARQEEQTTALVKKLGWFPKDRDRLQGLADAIKAAVGEKNVSWAHFVDKLMELADDSAPTK